METEDYKSRMARYAADFEAWARECVRIVDKESGREVPFTLNAPQRRVLAQMERVRRSRRPVRVIMLKARQWGGSTLVQIYMAWMQMVVCRGWNSLTCAHVKDAAAAIRGMYTRLLRCYPEAMKPGKPKDWELVPYEKSASTGYLATRDCQVAIATSMSPNSVRGSNFAMAHLSEVAFWADGDARTAEEIVRTVGGSVLRCPDSVVVMESTANGTDNYFYREWQRAVAGESDKLAIFVPWHEIEMYRREVKPTEMGKLLAAMDEYERQLLADGVPLEAVAWYHDKRREYQSHEAMMAEFPTTAEEAFRTSRMPVFDPASIPAPSALPENIRPALGVLVPSDNNPDKRWTFSLFGISEAGLHALSDESLPDNLGEAMRCVCDRCKADGVPLMIVEGADTVRSHAAWCAGAASAAGIQLCYDDDDRAWFRPEGDTLSEWIDTLAEMLRQGGVTEYGEAAADEYRRFRYDAPSRTPRVLARLAAACRARRGTPATDFASLL